MRWPDRSMGWQRNGGVGTLRAHASGSPSSAVEVHGSAEVKRLLIEVTMGTTCCIERLRESHCWQNHESNFREGHEYGSNSIQGVYFKYRHNPSMFKAALPFSYAASSALKTFNRPPRNRARSHKPHPQTPHHPKTPSFSPHPPAHTPSSPSSAPRSSCAPPKPSKAH